MSEGQRSKDRIPTGLDLLSMMGGAQSTDENTLALDDIRLDGGTQPRAKMNEDVIDDYAAELEGGAIFPAVIVFYDGAQYWLADGFHRWHAHQRIGRTHILADVRQGDQRAAILHSFGVNADHGVRRTKADKRRAVIAMLDDPVWAKWSNRKIGRMCKVDEKTVRNIRNARETPSTADYPQLDDDADYQSTADNPHIDETRTVERGSAVYEQKVSSSSRSAAQHRRKPAAQPKTSSPQVFTVRDRNDLQSIFQRLEAALQDGGEYVIEIRESD